MQRPGNRRAHYVPPHQRSAARAFEGSNGTVSHERRASPPRPSLLVGDLDACRHEYGLLAAAVSQLEQQQSSTAAPPEQEGAARWRRLVARFRALRESLTAHRCTSGFAVPAYELAADACLRAWDYPEFLKCLQQLLFEIYPRAELDTFSQADTGTNAAAAQLARLQVSEGSTATAQPPLPLRQGRLVSSSGRPLGDRNGAAAATQVQQNRPESSGRAGAGSGSGRPFPRTPSDEMVGIAANGTTSRGSAVTGPSRQSSSDDFGATIGSHNSTGVHPSLREDPSASAARAGAAERDAFRSTGAGLVVGEEPGNSAASAGAAERMLRERRQEELAGCAVLYFACVPAKPEPLDMFCILRGLPPQLRSSLTVRDALAVVAAVSCGDYVSFFRLREGLSWRLQAIMEPKCGQMRERALATLAASYRTIGCGVVREWLCLGDRQDHLAGLLKLLADRGGRAAEHALAAMQMENPSAGQQLVFKA